MLKNILSLILICFLQKIICQNFTNFINIGPNNYIVGINLDMNNYTSNMYNILNPNDADHVQIVIQQAITNIGINGGGTITIMKGIYILSKNLYINSGNLHLRGEGINTTIIKLSDFSQSITND